MKIYKIPAALQFHEWDEFWKQTKKDYPIQYFFRRSIPHYMGDPWREFFSPIVRICDYFRYKFHPAHQYNTIKPRTLVLGYHDPETRILHGVFHEVSEYAENKLMGDGLGGSRWTQKDFDYYDEPAEHWGKKEFHEQVETEKKIIELRNWWVIDRPKREIVEDAFVYDENIDVPEEWGEGWIFKKEYDDTPQKRQYRKNTNYIFKLEEEWAKEDQTKLHEVVDLLPHLWY